MSLDKTKPVEPSLFKIGEGCQGRTLAQPVRNRGCQNDEGPANTTAGSARTECSQRLGGISEEISAWWAERSEHPHKRPNREAGVASREVGAVHSSDESRNEAGAKGPHLVEGNSEAEEVAMAPIGEIATPNKLQRLQRTLYRKAKENGRWRAWSLYSDLCRGDVLETALKTVLRNGGAAGVDGVTTKEIKTYAGDFLSQLQTQLRDKSYRPSPVLRVWIPKADGKQRPLGIPTVKDRVVQTALVLLLQPIFEADFNEYSFGYRPGRNAHQALDVIKAAIWKGHYEVIDADLSGYFDSIPHAGLLCLVAKRVSDGTILKLVKRFLKAPIVEEKQGKKSIQPNDQGAPQGGPLSPVLSNLYLNGLDHGVNGKPELETKLVRYADDFVLLCQPGQGAAMYERLKIYLRAKGLRLNESKSRLLDVRQDSFQMLGFKISWRKSRFTGREYPHVEPSPRAEQSLRQAIRAELNHWTEWSSCTEKFRRVNRIVQGWSQYYHYGNSSAVFARQENWLRARCRKWLWKKYDRTLGRHTFFTNDRLYGQYKLWRMPTHAAYTR